MAYKLIVSVRAQQEIENAIDYYTRRSTVAPSLFIDSLSRAYRLLEMNPFFGVQYKKVHVLKINRFPYSLYFTIDEQRELVKVLACFHNKLNPKKRP